MSSRGFAWLGLISSVLASCKSAGRGDSQLKHVWGDTLRPPHALSCMEEAGFDPFFQSYVHKHINRLAAANSEVFREELDAKKFCVMLIESPEIDAGASLDGTLIFNTGLIQVADTDAQFAAAVAHELAHITLNHGQTDFASFVGLHPNYKAEADGILAAEVEIKLSQQKLEQSLAGWTDAKSADSLKAAMDLASSALRQELNKAVSAKKLNGFDACQTLRGIQNAEIKQDKYRNVWLSLHGILSPELRSELTKIEAVHCRYHDAFLKNDYQKRTLLSNWIETEADEAGYEFFIRAGYRADEYAQFFRNIDKFYGGIETHAADCRRGEDNHPKDCWRALHAVQELERHAADIQPLSTKGELTMVFDQDLAQLMKSYRSVQP